MRDSHKVLEFLSCPQRVRLTAGLAFYKCQPMTKADKIFTDELNTKAEL